MKACALAALVALGLATPATLAAPAPTPAQTIERIAPGGNITSVVRAVEARGWPHLPSAREMRDVADLVLAREAGRRAGAVRCYFGATMGRSYCGVNVFLRSQPPRPGRTLRYRVDVRVFEDGSYRIARPAR